VQKARYPVGLWAIWLLVFRFRAWGLPVYFFLLRQVGPSGRAEAAHAVSPAPLNKGLHAGPHLCFDFDFLLAPLILGARSYFLSSACLILKKKSVDVVSFDRKKWFFLLTAHGEFSPNHFKWIEKGCYSHLFSKAKLTSSRRPAGRPGQPLRSWKRKKKGKVFIALGKTVKKKWVKSIFSHLTITRV
jgi:hypothetical protein